MAQTPSRTPQPPLRVAVDTGGTFTDCIWMERGRLRMIKVFSTPADPSQAIAEALSQIGAPSGVTLLHGTTVGTNTLLQRKGARVAFVTTAGFEDTIEIGRQNRPKLYDLTFERVPPLVERGMRFGIGERVEPSGNILQKPSREDLRVLARDVHASGAESIAISTLFSFANPENERAIGRVLEELGLPLSLSHNILPEFREFERASTVVINAYLQPAMQSYLQQLDLRLRQIFSGKSKSSRVFVMQSNGGITSLEAASRQPVRTVLSGPAGGVVGAVSAARLSGYERVITFDMGGTSTDVALVDGEPRPGNEAEIDGLPVRVPTLDIHTVGAGGGSLARFDAGGALRVGPESAGADPGPICYGRGLQPTVTDANLLLGRLQPDKFLGGSFTLDLERTRAVTAEWLKRQNVRMSLEPFAEGVIRVVNANMERALRVVSVERGYDPRQFALVAFGGAGGLHACELAQSLGIPRVIIPAMPGALSAFGILTSDIIKDYSQTLVTQLSAGSRLASLASRFAALESLARREFQEEGWHGKATIRAQRRSAISRPGFRTERCVWKVAAGRFPPAASISLRLSICGSRRRTGDPALARAIEFSQGSRRGLARRPAKRLTAEKRRVWFSGKAVPAAIYERGEHNRGKEAARSGDRDGVFRDLGRTPNQHLLFGSRRESDDRSAKSKGARVGRLASPGK